MEIKLKSRKRYLFICKSLNNCFDKHFRANFIDIVCSDPYKQIRVFNYQEKNALLEKNILHVMPFAWIKNVLKLEDIIGDAVLPLDVVRIIDSFW